MKTDIIVLAAGKGTRMVSSLPKVLHPLAGRPLLAHVIDTARTLHPRSLRIVVGSGADRVRERWSEDQADLQWVLQKEQLGTGHAVREAGQDLDSDGCTLVLYGDVPLITAATLNRLRDATSSNDVTVLTQILDNPRGLGRILRDEDGAVTAIVEEKDATETQRRITEINTGILCIRNEHLPRWLYQLDNDNAQQEYYLTDIIGMAAQEGHSVGSVTVDDEIEAVGVNDRLQLSSLERTLQRRRARDLALRGVTVMDPERLDIRGALYFGHDVILDINVVIEGQVHLGDNVTIGPHVILRNCRIGSGTVVHSHSVVENAEAEENVSIGPFARIRPQTRLLEGSRIGNFVETKKAVIGRGSKVNHLSYIGDTTMGENVNIGAGTITCNYDGVNKHRTEVGDDAFVGSNTSLVAPVRVGAGATVAAGSTITADVPDEELGVARGRQRNIPGWKRPQRN